MDDGEDVRGRQAADGAALAARDQHEVCALRPYTFSRRVPSDVSANRLTERLESLRARGVELLDLTQSNPSRVGLDFPPSGELDDVPTAPYDPHPLGLPAAREAVAQDFARRGISVDSRRTVLTASTSESYSFLFKLLCDPGESVLIPRPSYPLLEHLTRLEGVRGTPYALDYHDAWAIDLAGLEERIAGDTRAIVVVSPNNPTGSFLTSHELEAIVAVCRRYGLALIGDEVFADYPLRSDGDRRPSVLDQRDVLTFGLGGLSKSAGLPGAKLGWMAIGGPPAAVHPALSRLELISDTYLSVSGAIQHAASGLLARAGAPRRRIASRVAANHTALLTQLRACPACRALDVEGGWAVPIQVPATRTEEALVLELLERDRVLVHPGYFFDFPREAFVVVSLLPDPSIFSQGIARVLARAVRPSGSQASH